MNDAFEHPKKYYRDLDKQRGKKHINVTLTKDEYQFVVMKSEIAGAKITPYFKEAALRNMAGTRHLNEKELDTLRKTIVELRRIGNNLNQIAHSANIGFAINPDEVKYQMRYLEDLIQQFFGKK